MQQQCKVSEGDLIAGFCKTLKDEKVETVKHSLRKSLLHNLQKSHFFLTDSHN